MGTNAGFPSDFRVQHRNNSAVWKLEVWNTLQSYSALERADQRQLGALAGAVASASNLVCWFGEPACVQTKHFNTTTHLPGSVPLRAVVLTSWLRAHGLYLQAGYSASRLVPC
jgi:hypothetical protein